MYQKKNPSSLTCGIELTKEVLSGKWKPSLLYQLSQGVQRPSDLLRHILEATRRVLNVQLNELERHGIIRKKIYPQLPPNVEYSLTDFSRTLLPLIEAMSNWGTEHRTHLERLLLAEKTTQGQCAGS